MILCERALFRRICKGEPSKDSELGARGDGGEATSVRRDMATDPAHSVESSVVRLGCAGLLVSLKRNGFRGKGQKAACESEPGLRLEFLDFRCRIGAYKVGLASLTLSLPISKRRKHSRN